MTNGQNDRNVWRDDPYEARVTVEGEKGSRRFVFNTTAPLQNYPEPSQPRQVEESFDKSYLDSQNTLFDALYALTLDDVRRCSVSGIRDDAYNYGKELPNQPTGGFFKTGLLWDYVWTRDISYALDLGLALLDPQRAFNSLTFKLSQRRKLCGDRQIIQDTGTGGSYPVSSDRLVWSLGARALLRQLQGEQRTEFAKLAYEALKNTIEHDRLVIFEPKDGLYRGEQSFLDWREQSYPEWTAIDPVHIGMSKALSTNACHLSALILAASLAEELGELEAKQKYERWAAELRETIHKRFYLPNQEEENLRAQKSNKKLYSAFITTTLDPRAAHQYDLLGNSLAILLDIADEEQARQIISEYPHLAKGAPVIWPQQQFRQEQAFWKNPDKFRGYKPIYHNRAIWPFVTAYWLRAAKKVKHDAALTHGVNSLIRGTALSLSNMENFDVVSGRVQVEEGPTVNSPRQLWSVAGYVAMVHEIIFGLSWTDRGFRIDPAITHALHQTLFANSQQLRLHGLTYRGHQLTIGVNLPPLSSEPSGVYSVSQIRLNGQVINEEIEESMLTDNNDIEVDLVDENLSSLSITEVQATDYNNNYRVLYGPYPPEIEQIILNDQGKLEIHFNVNVENANELTLNVYREGKLVAENIPGNSSPWVDEDTNGEQTPSYCYSLESVYTSSGTISQRAKPFCYWGRDSERIYAISADDEQRFQHDGGQRVFNYGLTHIQNWGRENDRIVVEITANFSGRHLIQLLAGNGAGPINTGITCAVKRLQMRDVTSNEIVADGYVFMPHLGTWNRWLESSVVETQRDLIAGQNYQITIFSDDRAINMSSFEHNNYYTGSGGNGGRNGPYNFVNIAQVKLLWLN